ncbi:DNA mismatch repair protein MSH6 [Morella rubra]|uniref:DNA mismatch repair protein MSH6 n=1 Tax=Morella rubra TaxID=262757 RepID=A0A6A1WV84_9ROSI|nr:DNA mismatch repair protein MSH6 [Morella rubra]
MAEKGLAKKRDKKEYGSAAPKVISGTNKLKVASVDNELRTGALEGEELRKAALGWSKEEESSVKRSSKSKAVAFDEDLNLGALKNEVLRRADGIKLKERKSEAKQVSKSSTNAVEDDLSSGLLKNEVVRKGADDKSMGKQPASKQSSKLKDIDVDDDLKLGPLKEEVRRAVSGVKSMGKRSAARKGEEEGGATLIAEGEDSAMKESEKDNPTPVKRKRGADGEIVEAFWLSPEIGSSRLRPRKEVPAFRLVDLEDDDNDRVVGKRVKVYWSGSRKWFIGRIKAFDNEKRLHNILYEDGDREMLDLRKERFELEVMPADGFKVRTKPSSEKKVKNLDGDEVSTETLKEDTEMLDAYIEPEKKTPSEVCVKEMKGPEVSKEEDLVAAMVVDVPGKAEEVVVDEGRDVKEATQDIRLESTSQVKEKVSDDVEGSRKTAEDDSIKVQNAKSLKNTVSSNKRTTSGVSKTRSSESKNRKGTKEKEDWDANMGVTSHEDETKDNMLHVDINVGNSVETNYQEDGKTNSLAEEVREEKGVMLAESEHKTPDFNVEKREDDQLENQTDIFTNDAISRMTLSPNPQDLEDDMKDLAANKAVPVLQCKLTVENNAPEEDICGGENSTCEKTEKAKNTEGNKHAENLTQYVRRARSVAPTR